MVKSAWGVDSMYFTYLPYLILTAILLDVKGVNPEKLAAKKLT